MSIWTGTVIWNSALMAKYAGVAQYDNWDGTAIYQCALCYSRSLTVTACKLPMSMPPKTEPPPGTNCACGAVIRPLVELPY